MEAQFAVKPRGDAAPKVLTVVNFHFKSKAGKERDPVDLEWETYRMQMAEALRTVAENRHAASFSSGESLLAVVGDRNSNFDAASARILEGALVLQQFRGEPQCRLTQRGFPICRTGSFRPARLFSVITRDPVLQSQQGTFKFKGTFSFLDDILMPQESLRAAFESFDRDSKYAAGIIRDYGEASDHAMVYVTLNW
jgi:predicted extracellular nuclease